MARGLLLRMIMGLPFILLVILIMTAGGQMNEPIYNATNNSGGADSNAMDGAEEAFGQSQAAAGEDAIQTGVTVGGIALVLIICFWIIFGSLAEDVNQGQNQF